MDDRRFDALTRSLATGLSRRKVLKGLFGGAVLGGAAVTSLDRAAAQCPVGQFFCNDTCCPNANNCCGGETCCPPGQCNQTVGTCCESFEFACGTGDNACCNTAQEKCCNGVCISAGSCCPSLPDCDACETCVQGACQPIACDPCETCVGGECVSTCEGEEICCTATAAAPYCAECCSAEDCPTCWDCDTQGACQETAFLCGSTCCPVENNCCGGTTCCPPSQCNQGSGTCCTESQFACGTGDNACCDIQTEKCCDGICISAGLCCPSLPDCPAGFTCCDGECVDLQNDPTNCGNCAADCSADLLCCAGQCRECCDNEDCEACERCVGNGVCEPLLCDDPCEFCDVGVDECVRVCPENQNCCVSGPPTDTTVECVDGDECCETDECGDCATCINGYCEPDAVICDDGEVACCVANELICTECCHDSDCDVCELCHEGNCGPCETGGLECCNDVCVPEDECCVHFGDECGVLITTAGGSSPPQLDCCDGLVCCETKHDSVCAECCSDHECPKGWICCAGYCREMECCIDDILAGLDPNRRCPDGCSCFEGICECHCQSNKDCAYGTCCCKDGTCAEHCCAKGCDHDKDCGYGACCCHDGSCSAHCCKKYTPPSYTPPVYTLPGTGSGDDGGGSSLAGAAAFGALAAYMAARKLRQQRSDEVAAEE